jgi:hypothetical protein
MHCDHSYLMRASERLAEDTTDGRISLDDGMYSRLISGALSDTLDCSVATYELMQNIKNNTCFYVVLEIVFSRCFGLSSLT